MKVNKYFIRYIKYWYIRILIHRLLASIEVSYMLNEQVYLPKIHKITLYYLAANSIDYALYKVMGWWGMDSITEEEKKYSKLN